MPIHRSYLGLGLILICRSIRGESRAFSGVCSRRNFWTLPDKLPQIPQTTACNILNVQLQPVQASCGHVQARLYSEKPCTQHGDSDCKKCNKEVSIDELTQLIRGTDDLKLVDVREPYELREDGSIPRAINIPLSHLKSAFSLECDQFRHQLGLTKPNKTDQNLVFFGLGSKTSITALEIAHKIGYKKSRHFPGGWDEWSKNLEKA